MRASDLENVHRDLSQLGIQVAIVLEHKSASRTQMLEWSDKLRKIAKYIERLATQP